MTWKPIKSFKKNDQDYPNRLVMLLVRQTPNKSDRTPLSDVTPGTLYTTMGHWFPKLDDEPGTWRVVGWDWEQDCFVDDDNVEIVAWQELPKAKF